MSFTEPELRLLRLADEAESEDERRLVEAKRRARRLLGSLKPPIGSINVTQFMDIAQMDRRNATKLLSRLSSTPESGVKRVCRGWYMLPLNPTLLRFIPGAACNA